MSGLLERRPGLLVLVDPSRTTPAQAAEVARAAREAGAAGIMIGSSFDGTQDTERVARAIREAASGLPLALFPGSALQLTAEVDLVLFLSLVSGRNAQYLIEEHVRAVPFLTRHPVATLSTGYILVDGGRVTSVEAVSQNPRLSSRGTGSHAVRGRRDQERGPGPGGAGGGSGLRGCRDRARGARGVGRRLAGTGPGGRRVTPAEQARAGLTALATLAARVGDEQAETIAAIADTYVAALRSGGTLFFAGNGGSAADAQHLATEYVVRYQSNRPALRAVALTTDSSLLTACANDMGFDEVFARQVEALARAGDVLSLHSTSGESPNVIRAAQAAKGRGVTVVGFVGHSGGRLKDLTDVVLVVPSDDTARIQEIHLAIEHVICEIVEERLAK